MCSRPVGVNGQDDSKTASHSEFKHNKAIASKQSTVGLWSMLTSKKTPWTNLHQPDIEEPIIRDHLTGGEYFPPSIVSATLLHQHASRSSSIVIDIVIVNSSFCNFRFDHIATSLLQMEKKGLQFGARTSMIQSYYPTMAVKYCGVSCVHHLGRLHQPIIDAECGCPSVLAMFVCAHEVAKCQVDGSRYAYS